MNLQYKTKSKPLKSAKTCLLTEKQYATAPARRSCTIEMVSPQRPLRDFTKKSVLRDVEHRWMYAHGESNPNRWNRNPVFYPLNYGRKTIVCECKVNEN